MRGAIVLSALLTAAVVAPQPGVADVRSRHRELVHGTKADDVLEGTDAGERFSALSGQDRIIAGGGDDILEGGPGADALMGGPGDDSYFVHGAGDGPDVILEDEGTDVLKLSGGGVTFESVELLRHGNDLLIRWDRRRPEGSVIIRSWFAGTRFQVEWLQLTGGVAVALAPLAARAREATLEDLAHIEPSNPGD